MNPRQCRPDRSAVIESLRSCGGSGLSSLYSAASVNIHTHKPSALLFDRLTERLDDVFRQLRGQGRISERVLDESLREIRRALLEADVNFKVAKGFLSRVRERSLGQAVMKSLTPGQQIIKIVHDELVALLGSSTATIELAPQPPTVVLLAHEDGPTRGVSLGGPAARRLAQSGRR